MESLERVEARMYRLLSQLPQRKRFAFSSLQPLREHFILKGVRGAGKTTLLLQMAQERLKEGEKVLYMSADHPSVPSDLLGFVEKASEKGYGVVIIDEVSYAPAWQEQVKAIVDDNLVEQLIISSSSAFSLHRARVDLVRRFLLRELKPFSLREYIYFSRDTLLPPIPLQSLLSNWRQYLHYPYVELSTFLLNTLPFYKDPSYREKLSAALAKMLTTDLMGERMTTAVASYAKALFEYVALSRGNQVSYGSIASALGISKGSVATLLQAMVEMGLLIEVKPCTRTKGRLSRARFAVSPPFRLLILEERGVEERGMLREDFFVHHMQPLCSSPEGDFEKDGILFEIGGYAKTKAQLRGRKGYVVSDAPMPKEGIPLHLFGYVDNPALL